MPGMPPRDAPYCLGFRHSGLNRRIAANIAKLPGLARGKQKLAE
jgi:hypothetical protein